MRADAHVRLTATGDTGLKEICSISAQATTLGLLQLREGAAGSIFLEVAVPATAVGVGPTWISFSAPLTAQTGQTWQVVFGGTLAGVVCVNGQQG